MRRFSFRVWTSRQILFLMRSVDFYFVQVTSECSLLYSFKYISFFIFHLYIFNNLFFLSLTQLHSLIVLITNSSFLSFFAEPHFIWAVDDGPIERRYGALALPRRA